MPTGKPILKPPRKYFPGHAMVRHGPSDWRCKCGHKLRYWRWHTAEDGSTYRIDQNGHEGAQQAMKLHRAQLWLAWNDR